MNKAAEESCHTFPNLNILGMKHIRLADEMKNLKVSQKLGLITVHQHKIFKLPVWRKSCKVTWKTIKCNE